MAGPRFEASPNTLKMVVAGVRVPRTMEPGQSRPGSLIRPWALAPPACARGPSVPTTSASGPLRAALHGCRAQPIPSPVVSPRLASREDGVAAPWVMRPAADLPAGGGRRVSGRRAPAPPPFQASIEPALPPFPATCGNGGRAFRSWASVGLAHVAPELIARKILGTYAHETWFARGKLGSHAPGKARLPQQLRRSWA